MDGPVFRHILVPLDGSRLAEAVLPIVTALACALGSRVTLFHAVERGAPSRVHGEPHLRAPAEAQAYLDAVARRLTEAGVAIEIDTHVHRNPTGDVAGAILDHAEELAADLIALATHGRGGLRDLLLGTLAQQVLRRGALPVLLVRPRADAARPVALRRLLVPLSLRGDAEPALSLGTALARALGAELRLIIVVPTADTVPGNQAATATLLPTAMAELLDQEARAAAEGLRERLAALQAAGVAATAEVRRGSPLLVLAGLVSEWSADLVVLGTHGRAALDALLSASVGSRLTAVLECPMILVRPSTGGR